MRRSAAIGFPFWFFRADVLALSYDLISASW